MPAGHERRDCVVGGRARRRGRPAAGSGRQRGLLRDQALQQVPASVTVLNQDALVGGGQQHFEDVLAQVPNLNWAGGTSRPRFFQIRGIGEREQYEGAPNPSVGFSDR